MFVFLVLPIGLLGQVVEEDSAGEFAQDFVFTNENGEEQRLSDYKGEIVYLSFWASWCKPCIEGFKKYKDIRAQLISKGVVLLNISIDKKSINWKDALLLNYINGVQGHTNEQEMIDDYQLYSVPRYEIIGKNGEFLYLDRSNGQSVMDNFDAFLKS